MLNVIFWGDETRHEFRDAYQLIRRTSRVTVVHDEPSLRANLNATSIAPPLIIIAVAFPNQFKSEDISALRRKAPFARVIALLGTWCEGEERTGRPWPADARVFWNAWPTWWARQLTLRAAGRPTAWQAPLTANALDRVLGETNIAETSAGRGLVAIRSGDCETFDAIAFALDRDGFATVWWRSDRPPSLHGVVAGIWNGGQLDPAEQGDLALFCRRAGACPVIALADFPRIETIEIARELGAAHVLAKPYSTCDLVYVLNELTRGAEEASSESARRFA